MARIVYDLDGTLVGSQKTPDGSERLILNTRLVRNAYKLKGKGHRIILWTFGTRGWWDTVRRAFPELPRLFHEVYTRDDFKHRFTMGRGIPEPVKDIRVIRGDVLVDNEPAHYLWAKRHQIPQKYVLVPTFGARHQKLEEKFI